MSASETYRGLSHEFFRLVKHIGEATSKQEEERIVRNEMETVKTALKNPDMPAKGKKELLVRAMYCEMLGFSFEPAYIHAVNLTQEKNILHKRTGYLAAALFLHPEHELIILLVHSLQRDLKSTNVLEVCVALVSTALLSADYIPAVLPSVVSLLQHESGMVRKKAVMALHSLYSKVPDVVDGLQDEIRKVLCDRDPAVMAATLVLIHDLVVVDKAGWIDLIPSFVSILKQVADNKLASTFSYHGVPAPWIQIQLLRIIGLLCADNLRGSESAYEVVKVAMVKADCGVFAGFSVVLEAVRTIATMYPNTLLLEMAANMVSKFIGSTNNNLRYVGITALSQIVALDPKYAARHAVTVLDSLEGDDDTLKRKTLDLLFKMTNPHNVSAVVERLLAYLRSSVDTHLRTDLVERIANLAERYAPSSTWYVRVMNLVFEYAPTVVSPAMLDDLLRLIAEGTGDDDADDELRAYAVSAYVAMIDAPSLPDLLIIAISWTLGEYTYLSADYTEEQVMAKLVELARRPYDDPQTRAVIISALTKLVAQVHAVPHAVAQLIDRFSNSTVLDIQQRCYEFKQLTKDFDLMEVVLPVDAANEIIDVDPALPFLDDFVARSLASGGRRYLPRAERSWHDGPDGAAFDADLLDAALPSTAADSAKPALRFDAYDNPLLQPQAAPAVAAHSASTLAGSVPTTPAAAAPDVPAAAAEPPSVGGIVLQGVSRRWGASGFAKPATSQPVADVQSAGAATAGFVSGFDPNAPATPTVADDNEHTPALLSAAPDSDSHLESADRGAAGGEATSDPTPDAAPSSPRASAREQQAQALFAGTSSLGLDKPVGVRIRKDRKPRGRSRSREPSSPALTTDTAPSGADSQAHTLSTQGSASLLDIFGGGSSSSLPPASPPPVSKSASASLLDLDGFGTSTPASTAPTSPGPPSDVFSFMTAPTPSPSAVASATSLDAGSSLLPFASASVPRSAASGGAYGWQCASGGRDCKTHSEAAVHVVLYLANASDAPLANIVVTYEGPSGLQVVADGDLPIEQRGSKFALRGELAGGATVAVVFTSTYRAHSLNLAINMAVAYTDSEGSSSFVPVQTHFDLTDLMRGKELVTETFGGEWIKLRSEAKVALASVSVGNAARVSDILVGALGVAPVDLIGPEAILAGSLLGSTLVLVHAKLSKTGSSEALDVTVRASDEATAQFMVGIAGAALS
ncbi:adaptin N terminal region domain-containing protein [Thecamonas trahens ATCC 50062]|uniref:Adaptin N terminal region domain-containing protein n=1 Tax=Thecamonas trahens ATCC 50062 TaxID=461836 RepID=A0A0L0DIS2_THETB|nr:adaptin N terminal region domain-containing protein [Thecamonas trahens ATCC 50062]KNC52001.1 adaptin N terminal region domain-containing protein [Thecamonas trahens ATCC 50062]|eukprot:XP_013755585.1 adaptin N terminal region domain-containing protein [Thecamonas trahens ATCC 50062]